MVQTRGRATAAAREEGGRTRSGQIPQSRIDAQLKTPLKSKDVQLRSVAPDARKREAKRRLKDVEEPAGRPGTKLDKDGDGVITRGEMLGGFAPAGLPAD